jgi:hypothetical protein
VIGVDAVPASQEGVPGEPTTQKKLLERPASLEMPRYVDYFRAARHPPTIRHEVSAGSALVMDGVVPEFAADRSNIDRGANRKATSTADSRSEGHAIHDSNRPMT